MSKRRDGFTDIPLPPENAPPSDEDGADPDADELSELDQAAALPVASLPQRTRPVVTGGREVEGMLEIDPSTLDPDFHYKWVSDTPLRIARHKMRGYVPVQADEGIQTRVEVDSQVDGVIRVGDTILMKCPKERVQARDRHHRTLAESRLAAPKKKFLSEAQRLGAEIITDRDAGTRRE